MQPAIFFKNDYFSFYDIDSTLVFIPENDNVDYFHRHQLLVGCLALDDIAIDFVGISCSDLATAEAAAATEVGYRH
jgi:hypothetical protein